MPTPRAASFVPAFIYVEASYSNPTGTALSIARKKELLDLSYRYGIPIIETGCEHECESA